MPKVLQFSDSADNQVTVLEQDAAKVIDHILSAYGYQVLVQYFKDYDPHKIIWFNGEKGECDDISYYLNRLTGFERYIGPTFG